LHSFYLVDGVASKIPQAGNLVHDRDFFCPFSGILLLLPLIYLTITGFRGKMRSDLPPDKPKGGKPNKKMVRRNEEDGKFAQRMNNECVPTFAVLSLINYRQLVLYQQNGIHFVGSCCQIRWSLFYSVLYLGNTVHVGCGFVMWVLFFGKFQVGVSSFHRIQLGDPELMFIFDQFSAATPLIISFLLPFAILLLKSLLPKTKNSVKTVKVKVVIASILRTVRKS
jgi:hypothetical protein